jgi:serine-type D-Ala-D-Ala carboxypeptidase
VPGFLPDESLWGQIMPTWNATVYRHRTVQGQVSDENSYAMGGIAGHAGVFSNVPDVMKLVTRLLWAPESPTDGFLNATTVKLFTTAYNLTQSSRALGWDTNDYKMNTYRGCDKMSPLTFTHTGYTGTEICADPVNQYVTILFTNRVYPNKTNNMDTIHTTRQAFNDAVLGVVTAN